MAEYTLQSCKPLGERDEKYGQTYWAEAVESDKPLMFNSMDTVTAGERISFESMEPKTSKKGTEYMRLKKVRSLGGASTQPSSTTGQTPTVNTSNQTDYIVMMLEELTGRRKPEPTMDKETETAKEVEAELDGDEPVNLEDIPF